MQDESFQVGFRKGVSSFFFDQRLARKLPTASKTEQSDSNPEKFYLGFHIFPYNLVGPSCSKNGNLWLVLQSCDMCLGRCMNRSICNMDVFPRSIS